MPQITFGDLLATTITLISWGLAIWALVYAKRSSDYWRLSLEQIITSRQLEQLQYIHLIIHVQVTITSWKKDLIKLAKQIELQDIDWLEEETRLLRKTWSSWIIEKYLYEKMPIWLSSIYESWAQYYYNWKSILYIPATDLIKYGTDDNELYNIYGVIGDLDKLLWYIRNEIPEVFLNAPDSINTDRFF